MKNRFLKLFGGMAVLIIFSKGLGFIRESLVAARFGAGSISDIYVFEDGFINAIYTVFAGVIATTYIPKITSLQGEEKDKFSSNYFNFLLLIIISIAITICLFTPFFLRLIVPGFYSGFDISEWNRLTTITRVNMISLILVFLENYCIVILQSKNYFIFSSIQGIVLNLALIVYLTLFYRFEIEGMILTKILAHLINVIFLLTFIAKKNITKYLLIFDIKSRDLREVIKLARPVFFVNLISQINYLVDRSMASGLDSGSMAFLSYANTIASLIYSVIGVSICQIAYTDMSEKQDNHHVLNDSFSRYFNILLSFMLPVCIVFGIYSKELSSIVFERGKLTSDDISVISKILILYIPSNFALCARDLHNRILYIYKETSVPSVVNMSGLILNIILNLILVKTIGVYGLALATSISSLFTLLVTIIYCKRISKVKYTEITETILKFIVSIGIIYLLHLFDNYSSILLKITMIGMGICISLMIFKFEDIKKSIRRNK